MRNTLIIWLVLGTVPYIATAQNSDDDEIAKKETTIQFSLGQTLRLGGQASSKSIWSLGYTKSIFGGGFGVGGNIVGAYEIRPAVESTDTESQRLYMIEGTFGGVVKRTRSNFFSGTTMFVGGGIGPANLHTPVELLCGVQVNLNIPHVFHDIQMGKDPHQDPGRYIFGVTFRITVHNVWPDPSKPQEMVPLVVTSLGVRAGF